MEEQYNLTRFLKAQKLDYKRALKELKDEKKNGHWMWYIFPQIYGLGMSETSKFYAIRNINEAEQYLKHPILGHRLIEISEILLNLKSNDPISIFGYTDSLKLKSSMTLFSLVPNSSPIFDKILEKFFNNEKDYETIKLINE